MYFVVLATLLVILYDFIIFSGYPKGFRSLRHNAFLEQLEKRRKAYLEQMEGRKE